MKKILLLCLFFIWTGLLAQNNVQVKSYIFLQELKKAKSDTNKVKILLRLSEYYFEVSKFDSSLIFNKQAISLSQSLDWEKGLAESNYISGNILLFKHKFNEAKINYENSLKIGYKINNCQIIGNNLIGIADVFSGLNDYNNAEKNYYLAKNKFVECNNYKGECLAYQNLALMFQKEGKNDTALIYFQRAIEISNKEKDKYTIAKIYGFIGNIHILKSNFSDALTNFQKALKIHEEINNIKGLINDYSNLGVLYLYLYTMPEALKYFEIALKLAEEAEDIQSIGKILLNKGIATEKSSGSYDEKNREAKLNEALKLYEKSFKIAVDLENKRSIGLSLERLGNINFWLNNYQKALTHFESAYKIFDEIGGKFEIASITGKLGVIYFVIANDSSSNINESLKKNYLNKGFEFVKKAIEQNKKFEYLDQLRTNYINISSMYYAIGDSINAIKFETELNKITLKMFQLNKLVEITKVEKEYELELQQKIFENENLKVQFQLKQSELERKNIEFKNLKSIQQIQKLELEQNLNKFHLLEKDKEIQSILLKQKDIANRKNIEEINRKNQERNYKIGAFVLIVLIFIISMYFWKMYKNNIALEVKNKIISDANQELDYLNSELSMKNEEIEISNISLLESNATKDKFFSIIAHDLRNPLTALISGSDLLLNHYHKYDDEKRLKHINKLSTSSNFLYKILENLLLWARSQTDNVEFSPNNHLLTSVINENIELFKLNLQEKNIQIILYNTDVNANFDRNMINTVIRNLLSNAIKFTPIGGKIELGAEIVKLSDDLKSLDNSQEVRIYVKDSGVGIPKFNLEKLFRIDTTVSSLGTNNEKGTGLGLILCKEFVEKHGGKIWVESEVGKGSTFWFCLPN